jgi:hypothetical protein
MKKPTVCTKPWVLYIYPCVTVKNPHPLPYGYGVDGYGYGSRKIYPGVTRVTP